MLMLASFVTYKVSNILHSRFGIDPQFPYYSNPNYHYKTISEINAQDNLFIDETPIREDRIAPKYPIILCHGFSGFDRLFLIPSLNRLKYMVTHEELDVDSLQEQPESGIYFEYWNGIQKALIANGSVVMIAKVAPMGSIEVRAGMLNEFINKQIARLSKHQKIKDKLHLQQRIDEVNLQNDGPSPKIKVNLVAHSMGGLDCRYLISKINESQKNYEVVSLTTISTPHRGSEVADYVTDLMRSSELFTNSDFFRSLNDLRLSLVPSSIYQLTTRKMKEFNKEVENDRNVKYFSYGARFFPSWNNIYRFTWQIVKDASGGIDNDGLISINSAKWGKYMGTIEDADHLDLINWRNPIRRFWRETIRHRKSGFDAIHFYLNIADDLAKEGL